MYNVVFVKEAKIILLNNVYLVASLQAFSYIKWTEIKNEIE